MGERHRLGVVSAVPLAWTKMRVGLVIYGSLDTVSGGYLYDRRLVEALRRAGDEVEIISLPWRSYARHLTDNRSAELLRRMSGDYDVLLQDELNHPSLAWANGRLGWKRPPIVAIVHHLRTSERRAGRQNRIYRLIEGRYLRSVDAFIYNSHTTRREVEALTGRSIPHVMAYPGGDRLLAFSHPRSAPRSEYGGPLRLLFVGNLIPRKGLHTLLEALRHVKSAWQLRVVGSPAVAPDYAGRVRWMAKRTGIAAGIEWLGVVGDADLAAEMAAADVLAVPSEYEGFGIVYLEGMAFGLPALATTAGAAHEIIADGENGFLVAPGDVAVLAARIELLAADRALRAQLGATARARFATHPSWEETTATIRSFLLEIANREMA
ncbi:MAG TPA: glycosyltransferase family 4 protein [Promineifilum sp.]|nr:glycosyltransferase family 4 protein [Promineifilum sp.]